MAPHSTSRPWVSLAGFWPFVIPIIACLVAQWLIHPEALREGPDQDPIYKYLIYDESDLTAMALRGLNAQLRRLPGRRDEPPFYYDANLFLKYLDGPPPPLAERFYLEYPTFTLPIFQLGYGDLGGLDIPPQILDGHQYGISKHLPRDSNEQAIWAKLNTAVRTYLVVMTLGLLALMLVLGAGYGTPDCPGGSVWLLVLPGAIYFSLNRFDVLPALATALMFACLGRRKLLWAGLFLSAGILLKVYPVVMVPVILRYLGWRDSLWLILSAAVTGFAAGVWSLVCYGWEGTLGPILVQLNRPVEEGNWIFYGRLLPLQLAYSKLGRNGILVLVILAMCVTRPQSLGSVLKRCVVILLTFNALAVFWSPQWMIWFLPLLVPLSRRNRWAFWAVVALDFVNYFSFPVLFHVLYHQLPQLLSILIILVTIFLRGVYTVVIPSILLWEWWQSSPNGLKRQREYFVRDLEQHRSNFSQYLSQEQSDKGLVLKHCLPAGAVAFAQGPRGELVALMPLQVEFEPVADSELADVPQAREPRVITAMMSLVDRRWVPVRTIFNLNPAEVIERSSGQLVEFNPHPK